MHGVRKGGARDAEGVLKGIKKKDECGLFFLE